MDDKDKSSAAPNENESQNKSEERKGNWITDMYDKMNVPVRALDTMLIILGLLIIFLFVFGNRIQLGF